MFVYVIDLPIQPQEMNMNWNLKKMWPVAAASLVAFTSILNVAAAQEGAADPACIAEPACPAGCLNPPARPQVQCGYNLFVGLELLYWSAYEYGLDYAMHSKNVNTYINNGDVEQMGNDYSWAFRFGVGYNLPHDGWDLYANWTFFNNDVSNYTRAPHQGALFPTWINPDTSSNIDGTAIPTDMYVEKANGKWDVELNIIDLELGREFFTSKYLTLRPHMGFRYVRLDQQWHVNYEGGNWLGTNYKYNVRNSNDFWGFGLRGGFDTQWGLGGGFSIYGNFALSLLHGHFHISQENYLRNSNSRQRTDQMGFNNRKRVGRAVTDLAMGIRWDKMFADDRFHLGVQFGWEHHMFWGQNQMWQMVNSYQPALHYKGNDEFTTQGWTFAARFDF